MLKDKLRDNLETAVEMTLRQFGADETLAYDVSKQCVLKEDVDNCLEVMLEHISEAELEQLLFLFDSDVFSRYTQAVTQSFRVIDERVKDTLYLLNDTSGSC